MARASYGGLTRRGPALRSEQVAIGHYSKARPTRLSTWRYEALKETVDWCADPSRKYAYLAVFMPDHTRVSRQAGAASVTVEATRLHNGAGNACPRMRTGPVFVHD